VIRTLISALLGMVVFALLCGVGVLGVVGARAAWRYHNRVDQPRLAQVSCRWQAGRVVVSGVVENPNDGAHRVFIVPHYRLSDGALRGRAGWVAVAGGDVIPGRATRSWRFVGSRVQPSAVRACSPLAYFDDED
jgi:hypothetical protein